MKYDILIIGAGAAGLMAARNLATAGKTVTILEARNRTGGRIHTLSDTSFFNHTELGAEFIHGDLPVTLQLLKQAGIKYHTANAGMWQYKNGKFESDSQMIADWDMLIKRLNELKKDTNIYDFLQKEFSDVKYEELRAAVWNFVSGYDTADPRDASTFALRNEWQHEEEDAQHRVSGGYCTLITYLANECKAKGGQVILNAVVKQIDWQAGNVKAVTANGEVYEAKQLIIALPLGVLQADESEKASLKFNPPIASHTRAIKQMGFGAVIKILFEFDTAFWLDEQTTQLAGQSLNEMGYLFSQEEIPTWWTQMPNKSTTLTGWIGGPAATEKKHTPDEELLVQGLQSLANIFKRGLQELKAKLVTYRIMNWTADPFSLGSYAYDTVEAQEARRVINTPVEDTIYFCGEYLYDGTAMGTVEAALTSAMNVAKKITG